MNENLTSFINMNTAMLMLKFTSMKTIMRLRLNCGRIILGFVALIKLRMTGGQCFVLEHIHKQLDVKFRGSRVNHGGPTENGNCHMGFSKQSVKNATGALETQPMMRSHVFRI